MLHCDSADPMRHRIHEMQSKGMSDDAIVNTFVQEEGVVALSSPPSGSLGGLITWIMPGVMLLIGFFIYMRYVRRNRQAPAPISAEDQALARTLSRASRRRRVRMVWPHDRVQPWSLSRAFIFILFVRDKDIPEPIPVSPIQHLEDRKQAIYENLRDLQFEYRLGKLSDEDYQQTKQASAGTGGRSRRNGSDPEAPRPDRQVQSRNLLRNRAAQSARIAEQLSPGAEVLRRMRKGHRMKLALVLLIAATQSVRRDRRHCRQPDNREAASRRQHHAGQARTGGMQTLGNTTSDASGNFVSNTINRAAVHNCCRRTTTA